MISSTDKLHSGGLPGGMAKSEKKIEALEMRSDRRIADKKTEHVLGVQKSPVL